MHVVIIFVYAIYGHTHISVYIDHTDQPCLNINIPSGACRV